MIRSCGQDSSISISLSNPGLFDLAGPGLAWRFLDGPGLAGRGMDGPSLAGRGMAGPGLARPGLDEPGLDGRGMDGPGMAGFSLRGNSSAEEDVLSCNTPPNCELRYSKHLNLK